MNNVIFFDFETTGLSPHKDHPTEIAMRKVNAHTGLSEDYSSKIKLPAGVKVSEYITELTGLTTEELNSTGKSIEQVTLDLLEFLGDAEEDSLFVGHNVNFDLGFLAVHFGIVPEKYMCTRTMAILTNPAKNASLQNVYNEMHPDSNIVQEHRAFGDIVMTQRVFNEFLEGLGPEAMAYFENRIVIMPDRELVYTPPYANILDFTKQYVSKRKYDELAHRLEGLEK